MKWEIGGLALATLLWLILLTRMLELYRENGNQDQRRECASFLSAALCLTLQLPTVASLVDQSIGVYDIARLFGNVAGVIAAWLFYPCLVRLWVPGPTGSDALASPRLMLVTIAALIGLFALHSAPVTPVPLSPYALSPFTIYHQSLGYTFVYMAYLGAIVFQMLMLSVRKGLQVVRSRITPPRLRRQLLAQALGWTAGIGFAIHESIHALLRHLGLPYPLRDPAIVSNGLLILAVFGVTGGELSAPRRWLAQYCSYRRLYPLWRLLYVATPTITLPLLFNPPGSALADAAKVDRITLRRLRRVVEIRDGILALQPFCDAWVAAEAERRGRLIGLYGIKRQAIVEAATLAVAGYVVGQSTNVDRVADLATGNMPSFAIPAQFEDELAHLERVASAVARSHIVTAIVMDHRNSGRLGMIAYPPPS